MALLRAAFRNEVARHDASLRSLGAAPRDEAGAWACPRPAGDIYHALIVWDPAATAASVEPLLAEVLAARGDETLGLCDGWDRTAAGLGLAGRGFTPSRESWDWRPAAPWPDEAPAGLEIRRVRATGDLELFARVESAGFGIAGSGTPERYGPALLDDPRLHFFLGYWEGEPVATAQAVVVEDVVGIYGVSTVPAARGHGIGSAMTAAAGAVADLPSVLVPSEAGQRLYRRLGFEPLGAFHTWLRRGTEA